MASYMDGQGGERAWHRRLHLPGSVDGERPYLADLRRLGEALLLLEPAPR